MEVGKKGNATAGLRVAFYENVVVFTKKNGGLSVGPDLRG